jgi:hypothetical protein
VFEETVVVPVEGSKYKQMGLKECAKFDESNGARTKLTGWGIICKDRQARGLSRKARAARRKSAE